MVYFEKAIWRNVSKNENVNFFPEDKTLEFAKALSVTEFRATNF